jgi:alpha-ketoglutaric semialdehyde dehydrogenase
MMTPPRLQSFIAGRWHPTAGDRWSDDLNPSDGQILAYVPRGTPDEAGAAVEAANGALPRWRALPGPARAELLHRWSNILAARQDELARAIGLEVGKPIGEARGEVARGVVILRYYAGEAVRPLGDVIPPQTAGALQYSLHEPLGVVALITPWNFPLAIPLWKAAPALAFGNTVVLKPAEAASQTATLLAATAEQAGIPAGVFNVLLGSGSVIGEPLLTHPAVRGVSFTGSGTVGARVAAAAAERNIKFQTEMGGKNVVIVAGDADLDRAATLTANGAMRYAGQKCTATSRAIVVAPAADAFLAKLTAAIRALPLGPVDDPEAAVGPMISAEARASVHQAVTDAPYRVVTGGKPADGAYARGFFYEPTVVCDVEPSSPLATEELFGPVLAVMTATDLDHAIALANAVPYGLSASLMTRDLAAALGYVHRIEAGLVRVNGDTTGVDPHAPFGGVKASSSGSREQGPAAREFYTEIKTVQLNP